MTIRRAIRILLAINLFILALIILQGFVNYLSATPVTIEAEENSIPVNYSVNRSYILSTKECLTFSWDVQNIVSIYFEEQGVGGVDRRTVCSHDNLPVDYELIVNGQNGEQLQYFITVDYAIHRQLLILLSIPIIVTIFYLIVRHYILYNTNSVTEIDSKQSWQTRALWLVLIVSPSIIASVYLFTIFATNLFDLTPFGKDGFFYWSQATSFAEAGLNNGYYSVDEQPAKIGMFHYYAWGPFVPMFYGTVAKFIGKPLYLIPVTNQILLMSATAIYVAVIRPSIKQSLLLIAVFSVFAPFIVYGATSMDLLLQLALSIVIAAYFWKLILHSENPPLFIRFPLAILLIIAAFCVRPTFGFLFLPYTFFAFPKHRYFAVAIAVGLMVSAVLAQSYVSAPYPSFRDTLITTAENNIFDALYLIISNILVELRGILTPDKLSIVNQQRLQSATLMLMSLFGISYYFLSKKDKIQTKELLYLWGMCIFTLVSIYLLVATALNDRSLPEFRWVAPQLLMLITMLIAAQRYRSVLVIIVLMIGFSNTTITGFENTLTRYLRNHQNHQMADWHYQWEDELADVIRYDESEENVWCNTLLFNAFYIDGLEKRMLMLAIDSGIGLSWTISDDWSRPLQSRYFLVSSDEFEIIESQSNVQLLHDLPDARLYLNLDANCSTVPN